MWEGFAMTVASGDVLRCTQEMNYLGEGAIQNVYHLRNEGAAITDAQALDDVIEVLESLAAILATLIAILQVVDGVRVINKTQLVDVGYALFVPDDPFSGAGTVNAKQVAFGLTLHTARLSVVGRKFWGVPVSGVQSGGGLVAPGSLTKMALAGDEMSEEFVATNSDWRYGVIASFDAVFLPFQSYSLTTSMITQRRRRSGVGI